MKRIVALCILDSDAGVVEPLLKDVTVSHGLVTGLADDDAIASLRDQGIIVEEVPEARMEETAEDREIIHGMRKARSQTSFRGFTDALPDIDLEAPQFFLIWLKGPLLEPWRDELGKLGIVLLEAYPGNGFRTRMSLGQVAEVNALSFVAGLRLFSGAETVADFSNISAGVGGGARRGVRAFEESPEVVMDILVQSPDERGSVENWCAVKNIHILGSGRRKVRIRITADDPRLAEISGLPGVRSVEEFVEPKPNNDRARVLVNVPPVQTGVSGLTGAGVIVGIADTGIDDLHADFGTRIIHRIGRGRPGITTDPHGHGTHVAGSVLGDGAASSGLHSGMAPAATLVFQSLLDNGGQLGGLPVDLNDLFGEAYALGARIHNNSWGSGTFSRYTAGASEVDEFVHDNRDMLIVISAGNDGIESSRTYSATGFVDWLSIGSPATAKNALTVGASRSDRTTGGDSASTWAAWMPKRYKNPPIAHETVSGDPESLAAFSSRGPCDNNSIKPDLVAPGTSILSAKSGLAADVNFEEVVPPPLPHLTHTYGYMSGTSMAAPVVSGCAALVREYYVRQRNHEPSAALLKATLVNGTRMLKGRDATALPGTSPNYHQGHGCIDMLRTVPSPDNPELALHFIDNWKQPGTHFTSTGQYKRYAFKVGATGPTPLLRVTLAYTDVPGRSLQNDLNVYLVLPGNGKVIGNHGRNTALPGPDHENNVEVLSLENPVPGNYMVVVFAYNILWSGQDFALVLTGGNVGSLTQV
ncbi:MAG: hypothetical protein EOP88_09325 [Verrucomicrobiaceae bacterium]|nr:MAG: hypothetical protein EOP88_09325 [Verrucomicrobiaceae bacterium]